MEETSGGGLFDWAGGIIKDLARAAVDVKIAEKRLQTYGVYQVGTDGMLYANGQPVPGAVVGATSNTLLIVGGVIVAGVMVYLLAKG